MRSGRENVFHLSNSPIAPGGLPPDMHDRPGCLSGLGKPVVWCCPVAREGVRNARAILRARGSRVLGHGRKAEKPKTQFHACAPHATVQRTCSHLPLLAPLSLALYVFLASYQRDLWYGVHSGPIAHDAIAGPIRRGNQTHSALGTSPTS